MLLLNMCMVHFVNLNVLIVGTRNNASLSKNTIFVGWHTNRFERRCSDDRETRKKQTKSNFW